MSVLEQNDTPLRLVKTSEAEPRGRLSGHHDPHAAKPTKAVIGLALLIGVSVGMYAWASKPAPTQAPTTQVVAHGTQHR